MHQEYECRFAKSTRCLCEVFDSTYTYVSQHACVVTDIPNVPVVLVLANCIGPWDPLSFLESFPVLILVSEVDCIMCNISRLLPFWFCEEGSDRLERWAPSCSDFFFFFFLECASDFHVLCLLFVWLSFFSLRHTRTGNPPPPPPPRHTHAHIHTAIFRVYPCLKARG